MKVWKNLFQVFLGEPKFRLLLAGALVTGILAGTATTAIIARIHMLISSGKMDFSLAEAGPFLLLFAAHATFGIFSATLATRLREELLFDLRMSLSRHLMETPWIEIEKIGNARILGVFTQVIQAILRSLERLPAYTKRLTLLVGLWIYMAWLSPVLFSCIAGTLVLGGLFYILPLAISRKLESRRIEAQQDTLRQFNHLVLGIKELLLNRAKKSSIVRYWLEPSGRRLVDLARRAELFQVSLSTFGDLLAFVALLLLIRFSPGAGFQSTKDLSDFLIVAVFSIGPTGSLVRFFFNFQKLKAALDAYDEVAHVFEAGKRLGNHPPASVADQWDSDLRAITFRDVRFTYRDEDGRPTCQIGPIDLRLEPGRIHFIAGGNGSGKTTLGNLICGLYAPDEGEIQVDGSPIDDSDREGYRQLFSAVFFQFHLFDSLLGLEGRYDQEEADRLRHLLQLQNHLAIEDAMFSLDGLSQGQQRRLALLAALLENRPVYLFDEWAADQDPEFKKTFYEVILPELKSRGKLVIVITHDEAYFHCADILYRLEDGRLADNGGI